MRNDIIYAEPFGSLELDTRQGRNPRRVSGRFPYNSVATLSMGTANGGKPKKEAFRPTAFDFSLKASNNIEQFLLFGHSYDTPLARTSNNSLELRNTPEALLVSAVLPETSYANDVLELVRSGLAVGISPGYQLPPNPTNPSMRPRIIDETAPEAQELLGDQIDAVNGNALITLLSDVILRELSIVSIPAYKETTVVNRAEQESQQREPVAQTKRTYYL